MENYVGPVVQVIVGVLTMSGIVWAAKLAGRWNARTKTVEATTPTYAEVTARLDKLEQDVDEERAKRRALEDRIDHLEDDRRADRSWIERTIRKVIDHDPQLVRLLLPWPSWVATTPPTLD